MSSASVKFLFVILLFFAAYAWWLVSWSFYQAPSVQEVYVPQKCGFLAGEVSREVTACCRDREMSYWQGGTSEQKGQVDSNFSQCLRATSYESTFRKETVFLLRPLLGTPYLHTPWRWGNGWPFGKGYRP